MQTEKRGAQLPFITPGVGKTHIAVALAVAACRAGYSIYITTPDDMVRNLKTAETAGRLVNKLGTYLRPSVLVVDEAGYQPLERAEANLVFEVISKRYEKGSIILTSNKTFSKVHMFRRTCARQRRNRAGSRLVVNRPVHGVVGREYSVPAEHVDMEFCPS